MYQLQTPFEDLTLLTLITATTLLTPQFSPAMMNSLNMAATLAGSKLHCTAVRRDALKHEIALGSSSLRQDSFLTSPATLDLSELGQDLRRAIRASSFVSISRSPSRKCHYVMQGTFEASAESHIGGTSCLSLPAGQGSYHDKKVRV